jgi:hypothetical protein
MEEQVTAPASASAPKASGARVPSIVVILAAILLCASYFLPFTTAKEDSTIANEYVSTLEVADGSGITFADMKTPSFVMWTRTYKALSDEVSDTLSTSANGYQVMFVIFVASIAVAALAALFGLLRKAVPTVLFALANLAVNVFIGKYFGTYGPVASGGSYDWAPGHVAMLAAAAVLAAAGIWLFVAKHAEKKAAAVGA